METLIKIGLFFFLFICLIGCFGTIGWLIYEHAYVILVGAVCAFSLAVKPWYERVKQLINK